MIKQTIPTGWRELERNEPVLEGDHYYDGEMWMESNNWRYNWSLNKCQANGYQYIRKVATEWIPAYKIGDKVMVEDIEGVIKSPRFYLTTGYGYVIEFGRKLTTSVDWPFKTIYYTGGNTIPIREDLIKPVPKTKVVKLDDNWDAVVSKTTVKVGCLTLPYDVIKEIVKAHDSI